VRVVGQCLVPLDREDVRGEEGALGVTLAFREIDEDPHAALLPLTGLGRPSANLLAPLPIETAAPACQNFHSP